MPYTDANIEKAIQDIEEFDADFGGTEIGAPIMNVMETISDKNGFEKHVIILTDGQVNEPEIVIQLLGIMYTSKIARTHMVGVGDGVSYDMIRIGANVGGGEHMFIMDEE